MSAEVYRDWKLENNQSSRGEKHEKKKKRQKEEGEEREKEEEEERKPAMQIKQNRQGEPRRVVWGVRSKTKCTAEAMTWTTAILSSDGQTALSKTVQWSELIPHSTWGDNWWGIQTSAQGCLENPSHCGVPKLCGKRSWGLGHSESKLIGNMHFR